MKMYIYAFQIPLYVTVAYYLKLSVIKVLQMIYFAAFLVSQIFGVKFIHNYKPKL